ncbi:MAG: zf-HC2 domain-containing protein [Gemmatimonadota bacterium]|nr:zf-HC2 domain-containing protein [Gemmatimonadota bacterium]
MPATSPCSWTQERIEAYIDGELTPVEQDRLETHAATCAACAAELKDARRLVGELRDLPALTCPDAVSQALQDRIYRTRQDRWRTAAKRWYKPLAAAAVLVLIAGYHLFDPEPVPPTFSPKEVAQARRQVEWTLAYLDDLNSRMGTAVRDDVIQPRLVQPLRLNLDAILPVQTM